MDVSVESGNGLTRRVSVSIPSSRVEEQIEQRLKHLAAKVKLDGFRPGKAPISLIKKQYLDTVKGEVAQGLLEETLTEALQEKSLSPVSSPAVEKFEMEPGQNFNYTVSFEVLPEIEIVEPDSKTKIEWLSAKVESADVDAMIEKLREQNKTWAPVKRAAKKGDQVKIDFKGFVDGEPLEQGDANDFTLELGTGNMIPGFEDEIIGHKAGESFTIQVTFPEEYHEAKLSGKKASFDIVMHEVSEGVSAEVNADFVKQFGVESGDLKDLRADITVNMERELARRVKDINQDACFEVLASANPFDLPTGLIDKEIEHLKHEMYHRIFGPKHSPNEKIPDFPRELFEDRAKKRVHLGLLFAEYVKKHRFVADETSVDAMIEQFSSAYDDPAEFKRQCREDKNWMAEIESAVIEAKIADQIRAGVSVKDKKVSYQEAMDYKNKQVNQEEA